MANLLLFIGGFGGVELLLLLLIPLLIWVYALVQVVTGTFQNNIDKLVWLLLLLMVPPVGVILYFLVGRKRRLTN